MSLYIVASPIGNMEDISLRALRILKEVDLILTEDTRVSAKLLNRYDIKNKMLSFHHHSKVDKYETVLKKLQEGLSIALLSDAGTPSVSDPGGLLIEYIRDNDPSIEIDAIPGPSALTTALSLAGIKIDKFLFYGFLAHKKGRAKAVEEIFNCNYPVVLFESKHRILKLLKEFCQLDKDKNKKVLLFRELTKMHYSFYSDTPCVLLDRLSDKSESLKGEFTLIIY